MNRLKIIGVMGSGEHPYRELAEVTGRLIARAGCHLLTGGGHGVMEATACAFTKTENRKGLSIGIIRARGGGQLDAMSPSRPYTPGAVNEYVDIAIKTHLPYSDKSVESRNHINVLTPDALIILPGDSGTYSEFELAVEYGTPVALFVGDETVAGRSCAQMQEWAPNAVIAHDAHELAAYLENYA